MSVVLHSGAGRVLHTTPVLDFRLGGQPAGPESFYELYPFQVSVSASGTIGVLNRQAYEAVTFDATGGHLATYGRQGGGPGEFRFPSSIAVRPDGEVLVFDFGKRALVGFSAGGEVLDERRLSVPFNGVGMVGTALGLTLLSEARSREDGTGVRRVLSMSASDTVQLGPGVSSTVKSVTYASCGVNLSQPPLFAADLIWASNGVRTAIVAGPEYVIWVFDGTDLKMSIRRDMAPEVATEDVAAREVGEGERWNVGGRDCLVPTQEVVAQRGYGTLVPIVEALAVTPAGGVWVKRRNPGEPSRSVDVFDDGGNFTGTFESAPPFPLAFLPDGRTVVIEKDSLDVGTVAVYRVESGGK